MLNDFDEYIKQGEPNKKEKGYVWQTAIGLQQVDGLKPSAYLIRFLSNLLLAENNILKNRELHISFVAPANADVNVGEMSDRQNQILEIMTANKTISARQLSELLNTTARTIEREIKKMKEMNIIERIGGDRGGHWEIKHV
ncbi:MAG: HTH domain-containing protein [Planctomycetaceae bacterium]|nr:HTH domain-containing protein [Planctomycetaceae bacterium]